MGRRANPERDTRAAALYSSGLTAAEVAGEVGLTESGVFALLRRLGIKRRRGMALRSSGRVMELSKKGMLKRWGIFVGSDAYVADADLGLSVTEIARKHGVSHQAVSAGLKRRRGTS